MNINDHITRIYNKLQLKLKHINTLEKENAKQLQEINLLKQQQQLLEEHIKTLQEQNHILKAAAGKMEGPDKLAFEQSINKYIREIDKCIGLLRE